MGVEFVREGHGEAGDGETVGEEKQIPRLRLGMTKRERAKNAREMGHPVRGVNVPTLFRKGRERRVGHPGHTWATLTRKQRGEMAEAAFLAMAARLGFRVSKPWGESSRYDLIVDNGRRLLRVQVKSAHRADQYGGYTFHAHGNTSRAYRASEIDLLVAYVVPAEAWYLFPVEEFRKYKSMKLFPASRRRMSKFEKFRENWGIVR
jgi:PD-(D/E)XK nuclease superfamily protein